MMMWTSLLTLLATYLVTLLTSSSTSLLSVDLLNLSSTKVSFRFCTTSTFTWLFAVKMTNVVEELEQLLNGNLKAEFKIGELKGRQILKKSHEGS